MKKMRLYLDTSVISHLDAPDTPEKMQETLALWEDIRAGKYEIVLSDVVFEEIEKCEQPKKQRMYEYLAEIKYTETQNTKEIENIANHIIQLNILQEKHYNYSSHIACAIVRECDFIVSWNFKHLVNPKTVKGVGYVVSILRYKNIDIVSPPTLLNMEEL